MNELQYSILRILSDGEIHSATLLAYQLNCSRATILEQISYIDDHDIIISKLRFHEYRWINPIKWLSYNSINQQLNNYSCCFKINIFNEIPSTNDYLLSVLDSSITTNHPALVILTELQKLGRGQRGRSWHTGLGDSLTFSLLWRFENGASSLSGLSLCVAVATIRVFRQLSIDSVYLKWPNDILFKQKKIAGTLIEIRGEMEGPSFAVIGIGINFDLSSKTKLNIDQPVGDLYEITGSKVDRNSVLAPLLIELRRVLLQFTGLGFQSFVNEWNQSHFFNDKAVILTLPDSSIIEGVVKGVDCKGSLMLSTCKGTMTFNTGSISLPSKD